MKQRIVDISLILASICLFSFFGLAVTFVYLLPLEVESLSAFSYGLVGAFLAFTFFVLLNSALDQ